MADTPPASGHSAGPTLRGQSERRLGLPQPGVQVAVLGSSAPTARDPREEEGHQLRSRAVAATRSPAESAGWERGCFRRLLYSPSPSGSTLGQCGPGIGHRRPKVHFYESETLRWHLHHWAERKAYVLGLSSGGMIGWEDGRRSLSISWRGKRCYFLGKPRWWWDCHRRHGRRLWRHHKPMAPYAMGICAACVPCPSCGSLYECPATCEVWS